MVVKHNVSMAQGNVFLPDEKAPLYEDETSHDLENNTALSPFKNVIFKPKRSTQRIEDFLPSVKDILRLVMFTTATVIGMTFIFGTLFKFSGSVVCSFLLHPTSGLLTQEQKPRANHELIYDCDTANAGLCPSSGSPTSLSMDFKDSTRFAFTQLSGDATNPEQNSKNVRTVGSIEVRNAVGASESSIHVDLEIHGSNAQLTSSGVGIEKTDSTLVIRTPSRMSGSSTPGKTACLNITVIISISPGTKLEHFGVNSETMAVNFHPGLDYAESRAVETKAQFNYKSTYSRETIIDVGSVSVTGSYPLYDLLSIHTSSGSINIDVEPKKASTENVKPAVLRVTSNSGSVRAMSSTVSVPDRDYQTTMSTSSGSMNANILHGLRTSLRSINGRITADLHPYGHNDSRTDIEVHDTSGSMDITLHSSLSHPTAPLRKLYGYYRGNSGSMNLYYPGQWQGTVEGTTMSGSIDLDWQGLKVVKDNKEGYVKRTIEAVKGEGEGRLVFYQASGSVKLSGERR